MKILGIETSCDETAVCILEASGGLEKPHFTLLGNALYSQVKIHAEYGGVFPALAKREHAKNIVPLLTKALEEAKMLEAGGEGLNSEHPASKTRHLSLEKEGKNLQKILEREPGLFEQLQAFLEKYERPDIDAIAVTSGPGLEPALWVGINFARALGEIWNIPVIPTNHMEGHIVSPLLSVIPAIAGIQTPRNLDSLIQGDDRKIIFPALALLISGGHTELVLMKNWLEYETIGATRDDAVGEAFDKVARILGLPYPGGPEISKLAAAARQDTITSSYSLPRPMIHSKDFNFSFSGLKTAVLYTVKKIPELSEDIKKEIALEFENAVTEVLISKTKKALEEYGIETLILGGGVIANTHIRESFKKLVETPEFSELQLLIPEINLSTDNAVMIAMAAYINISGGKKSDSKLMKAEGNLKL